MNTTLERQQALADLIDRVPQESFDDAGELHALVKALERNVSDSNPVIAERTLLALDALVEQVPRSHRRDAGGLWLELVPKVAERLADRRDEIRSAARQVILALLELVSADDVFRVLVPTLSTSRKPRVKDGVLDCYLAALENVRADSLPLALLVPVLVSLLDDADRAVRELAFKALGETYRYVGKRIFEWTDKENATKSNAPIWQQLLELFAEIDATHPRAAAAVALAPVAATPPPTGKAAGKATTTTTAAAAAAASASASLVLDFTSPPVAARPPKLLSRAAAKPADAPAAAAAPVRRAQTISGPVVSKVTITDPESVEMAAFGVDDQKPKPMASISAVSARLDALAEPLVDVTRADWTVRVNALQELRALAQGVDVRDAHAVGAFCDALHRHHRSLTAQVLDLRSSVCKEVCASISKISVLFGAAFGAVADECVPALLKLTYVSKDVMASSGNRCLRGLMRTTRLRTALAVILQSATGSANGTLRARCQEYLELLVAPECPSYALIDAHAEQVMGAIVHGIGDASPAARDAARRSYVLLDRRWPDLSSAAWSQFDSKTQRKLVEARDMMAGEPPAPALAPASVAVATTTAAPAAAPVVAPAATPSSRPVRRFQTAPEGIQSPVAATPAPAAAPEPAPAVGGATRRPLLRTHFASVAKPTGELASGAARVALNDPRASVPLRTPARQVRGDESANNTGVVPAFGGDSDAATGEVTATLSKSDSDAVADALTELRTVTDRSGSLESRLASIRVLAAHVGDNAVAAPATVTRAVQALLLNALHRDAAVVEAALVALRHMVLTHLSRLTALQSKLITSALAREDAPANEKVALAAAQLSQAIVSRLDCETLLRELDCLLDDPSTARATTLRLVTRVATAPANHLFETRNNNGELRALLIRIVQAGTHVSRHPGCLEAAAESLMQLRAAFGTSEVDALLARLPSSAAANVKQLNDVAARLAPPPKKISVVLRDDDDNDDDDNDNADSHANDDTHNNSASFTAPLSEKTLALSDRTERLGSSPMTVALNPRVADDGDDEQEQEDDDTDEIVVHMPHKVAASSAHPSVVAALLAAGDDDLAQCDALSNLGAVVRDGKLAASDAALVSATCLSVASRASASSTARCAALALVGLCEARTHAAPVAVLERYLGLCGDSAREVSAAAEALAASGLGIGGGAELTIDAAQRRKAMDALLDALVDSNGGGAGGGGDAVTRRAQCVSRLLQTCVTSAPAASVDAVLCDRLCLALSHALADVRKAAVCSLASLHVRLGAAVLESAMAKLNGSQKRLIDIYVKRLVEQK
jgi:hypothetical protein